MSEKITVDRDAVERAISALDSITVWDNNTIGSIQAVRRASTDLRQALIQSDGQQQANDTQHLADMKIKTCGLMMVPEDLLERLAPEEPINQDEMGGCVWCTGTPPGQQYGYAGADPSDHEVGCPWVQARALLDAEGEQLVHTMPVSNGWELLPEDETYAMHVAVMEVLYQKGVTRTTTHLLWQAYRRTLIESIAATNSHRDAEVNLAGWVREWEGDDSDVGQWLFAATEEEKDDSPNWQPVYWRSNIIPPGYVLVSEQKLKQLKASVSGECYQGELWELETLSDMIKND